MTTLKVLLDSVERGSLPSIRELGEKIIETPSLFPRACTSLLRNVARWSPPETYDPHDKKIEIIQASLSTILSGIPHALAKLDTITLSNPLIENWAKTSKWLLLFTTDTIELYEAEGEFMDPIRLEALRIARRLFARFSHMMTVRRRLDLLLVTPDYGRVILRIWVAHARRLTDEEDNDARLDFHLLAPTLSQLVSPEIGKSYISGMVSHIKQVPDFLDLLLKPLEMTVKQHHPDRNLLHATAITLFMAASADPPSHFDKYPFVRLLTKNLAHLILREPPVHHTESDIMFMQCVGSIGITLSHLLCHQDQFASQRAAQALHCGLLPSMQRLAFLGQCNCKNPKCPWTRIPGDEERKRVMLRPFKKIFDFLSWSLRAGRQYVFVQTEKGLVAAGLEREALEDVGSNLKLTNWRMWDDYQGFADHMMNKRNTYRRTIRSGVCIGPACPSKQTLVSDLKTCGGCREMFYCSRQCQKDHWKVKHAGECGANAQRLPNAPYPYVFSHLDQDFRAWLKEEEALGR